MRQGSKRLMLNKESLRRLNSVELRHAAGGIIEPTVMLPRDDTSGGGFDTVIYCPSWHSCSSDTICTTAFG